MPSATPTGLSNVVDIDPLDTLGISTVTMLILVLSVVTSAVDRRFYAQRLQLAWAESKVVLNHTVRVGEMEELTT